MIPKFIKGAPRTKRGWWKRLKFLTHYLIRSVITLHDTPHRISLGCAMGVFIAFQPIVGIQMVVGGFITWLLRGNVLASLPPAWITNPVTIVPIYYGTYLLGAVFTGGSKSLDDIGALMTSIGDMLKNEGILSGTYHGFMALFDGYFIPMVIGGLLVGIPMAVVTYFLTIKGVKAYQHHRDLRRLRWRTAEPATDTGVDHPN